MEVLGRLDEVQDHNLDLDLEHVAELQTDDDVSSLTVKEEPSRSLVQRAKGSHSLLWARRRSEAPACPLLLPSRGFRLKRML